MSATAQIKQWLDNFSAAVSRGDFGAATALFEGADGEDPDAGL